MPRNMRWDPISNVAEVWCCSEHYLWLFDDIFIFGPIYCDVMCRAVVSEDAKTTLASILQTLSLERESNTVSEVVC